MTLREVLYVFVGILMAYISWLLLRFLWLGLPRKKAGKAPLDLDGGGTALASESGEEASPVAGALYDDPSVQFRHDERSEPKLSRPLEPDAGEFGFDALLEMRQLRHHFDEMRRQQESLQAELTALRDQVSELRAAAQVSPVYSEAVTLARRGYDAQVIADQCGISIAEAELVRSLTGDTDEERSDE